MRPRTREELASGEWRVASMIGKEDFTTEGAEKHRGQNENRKKELTQSQRRKEKRR
jgi:hypothetical protein